jgi:2-polyprenyl-3-methyl-5-hydroxy-6-metoxy-1,4-benzoquinol methylase
MSAGERPDLNQTVGEIWDQNAGWWDDYIGEGNDFHHMLIAPAVERLLEIKPGETALDVACGNGNFSRRIAALGATVVAFDASQTFIDRARQRTVENTDLIEYRLIDATQGEALLALGERRFDAAACNMALMDMAEIQPLLAGLARLLKPGGRFVFSIMHPAFNSLGSTKVVEEIDRDGTLITQYAIKIHAYIQPQAGTGLGIIGQPQPHYYFHRPLSLLFNQCFQAGFMMDRLEEPVFAEGSQSSRAFSWDNFHEIPPALIARLRLIPGRDQL